MRLHASVRIVGSAIGLLLLATQVRADAPLKPIFFDSNSYKLTKEAQKRLDAVAEYLKAHSAEQVVLVGSTDPRGAPQVNFQLRRQRSGTAKQYLVDHGVPEASVEVRPAEPPSGDIAPSEYAKLRRVAFETSGPVAEQTPEEKEKVAAAEKAAAEKEKHPEKEKPDVEPKDEKGLPILNVLYWKSVNHALWILAKEEGKFEEEGLHVNLKESQLEANDIAHDLATSGEEVEKTKLGRHILDTKELKDKKFFIGAVCAYGFNDALSKKLTLIEVGSMVSNINTMIMKKPLLTEVKKDIKAFKGHTLARVKNQPTAVDPVFLFMDKLSTVGLKEGTDYTIKWYESWSDSFEAVAKGEVDTVISWPPLDIELTEKHPELGLLYIRELFPYMPCCRQVVTRGNLRRNRDRYVHFERAVIKAHKFYIENPDKSVKDLAKFLGMRESMVKQILVTKGYTLTPDPMFKGAQAFRKSMVSFTGAAKLGGDLREAVDTSIYEDALVQLQKENPNDAYYSKMIEAYQKAN